MRTEVRGQRAEVRMRSPRFARWMALFAVLLAAGCASPPAPQFTDADWVSASTTGRNAYERGDYRRAAVAYDRAEQRARALDDAEALALSAVNRATCLLAAGQAADARKGLAEALADERISPARRAELLVAAARVEAALGKSDEAVARATEALERAPSPALRAQALLAKSGAELAKEDPAAATKTLAGMSTKEWQRLPASLQAEQTDLRARIAVAEKQPAAAMTLQDEAAQLWKQAGRLPEMARALAEAGRQAQAAGDLAGAADRFYRAARSLGAQGLQPEALHVLEEGVSCAEQIDDEAVAMKMAGLLVTFRDEQRLGK